jgi:hypothetical protein
VESRNDWEVLDQNRRLNMGFMFFPASRLLDHLSRHGFRVSCTNSEDDPTEYVVSRGGRIVATVTPGFGKVTTVTYGEDDPQLVSIARRYGEVSLSRHPSPGQSAGTMDVTGKAVAYAVLPFAAALIIFGVICLLGWWFGWEGEFGS